MITIAVKGIDSELKKAENNLKKQKDKLFKAKCENIKEHLVAVTPVDTGLARASWQLNVFKDKATISNNQDYIERLNQGSSKQAPSHFIEGVVLQYGKPAGSIVNIK